MESRTYGDTIHWLLYLGPTMLLLAGGEEGLRAQPHYPAAPLPELYFTARWVVHRAHFSRVESRGSQPRVSSLPDPSKQWMLFLGL